MLTANVKELALIFLAISCQLFACMNLSFLNKHIQIACIQDPFFIQNHLDLTDWILWTTLARILGAYFLGKYAHKLGLSKAILFMSASFTLIAVLGAAFCITQQVSYEAIQGFYIIRFFYCFFEPAALILPALYILDNSSRLDHYKISALLLIAVFVAKSASYHLIYLAPEFLNLWYILAPVTTSSAWIIYRYLGRHSKLKKALISSSAIMPLEIKILAALIGAACATGIFYHHFFASYYSLNIKIVETSADLGSVTYYVLCALFFLPASKLCEKFGLYKTALLSLFALFILGVNSVLSSPDSVMYVAQQVLFSFFTSLFISPALVVLYRVYKNYSNGLAGMHYFVLGFGLCTLLARLEQQVALQKGLGWCVYSISIVLCFMAIHKVHSTAALSKKLKSLPVTEQKVFEA